MLLIVAWLIFSILVEAFWGSKDRSFAGGLFVSLLLSPVIGFTIVLVLNPNAGKQEDKLVVTGTTKRCPYCEEIIKSEAIVCRYCGIELENGVSITKSLILSGEDGKLHYPYCSVVLASADVADCWYCHKSLKERIKKHEA